MNRSEASIFLGIPLDAPGYLVRKAYRKKLFEVHPDTSGNGDAALLRMANVAYEILKEPFDPSMLAGLIDPWLMSSNPDEDHIRLADARRESAPFVSHSTIADDFIFNGQTQSEPPQQDLGVTESDHQSPDPDHEPDRPTDFFNLSKRLAPLLIGLVSMALAIISQLLNLSPILNELNLFVLGLGAFSITAILSRLVNSAWGVASIVIVAPGFTPLTLLAIFGWLMFLRWQFHRS